MRKPKMNALRALIVGGVMLAVMGCPLAYADGRGDDGSVISDINNGNSYNYQGVGNLTLENVLGSGADSLLLAPIRTLAGRLAF
ncbi:hypothetical protein [Streptomyces sp. NPDC014733]|uniref:hypothetical protein n=1 Tax=Streptomyces sp. NPDC014733 TaxID=3364885 RepID=UPI0036FDB16E